MKSYAIYGMMSFPITLIELPLEFFFYLLKGVLPGSRVKMRGHLIAQRTQDPHVLILYVASFCAAISGSLNGFVQRVSPYTLTAA